LELKHYPIFVSLEGRPVLVVGAGKVALRKTRGLIEAGARVTVVAPEWESEFESLPVRLMRRPFCAADLAGCVLVFAATNDRLTNHRIGVAAKGRGIFANIADSARECDFILRRVCRAMGSTSPFRPAAKTRGWRRICGRSWKSCFETQFGHR